MKLLTCLGTGSYGQVTYTWGEKDAETCFFPLAISKWLKPKQIFVLLTDAAAQHKNWTNLKSSLPNAHSVCIPDGKNESEYWEIFQAISSCVEEGDEFVFDITHGFRSIPLLAFLASAYLRSAKSMRLQHVLYGAYEARTSDQGKERAPVFDLAPFLTLLDWTYAARHFQSSGDARPLSGLIKTRDKDLWNRVDDPTQFQQMPRSLASLADSLNRLSQALLTVRQDEIPKAVQALDGAVEKATDEVERWASPFVLITKKIAQSYADFSSDSLQAQLKWVHWYADNGHILQAISLAREWLVSLAQSRLPGKSDRQYTQDLLNKIVDKKKQKDADKPTKDDTELSKLMPIADIWDSIRALRNDLAHCGFGRNPVSSDEAIAQIKKAINDLSSLTHSQ
ncbi:MAG: TIGR02221 family CRISPR-associated protein [Armatimonadetes bacterium]|nr:TIGR02221 family CRISPR-associated protein [Armatimonadota bacterium]